MNMFLPHYAFSETVTKKNGPMFFMDQLHKQYKTFWGRMKKRPACGVKKKFLKTLILHVHCTHIISCTIFIFKSPLCNRVGVEKKHTDSNYIAIFFQFFGLRSLLKMTCTAYAAAECWSMKNVGRVFFLLQSLRMHT